MRCDYRACTSKLCMLTCRFYTLSKPVIPVCVNEQSDCVPAIQYAKLVLLFQTAKEGLFDLCIFNTLCG